MLYKVFFDTNKAIKGMLVFANTPLDAQNIAHREALKQGYRRTQFQTEGAIRIPHTGVVSIEK